MFSFSSRTLVLLILLTLISLAHVQCSHPATETVETRTIKWLQPKMQAWQQFIADTLLPLAQTSTSSTNLQQALVKARQHYKTIEWAVAYFMPSSARQVNGPPVDEVEVAENISNAPQGLQVIETMLYPVFDTTGRDELVRQCKLLAAKSEHVQTYFSSLLFEESQVMDALRLSVYRVATLGITGFDAPLSQTAIQESAIVLSSIQQMLIVLQSKESKVVKQLQLQLQQAIQVCNSSKDFNQFDRLLFISKYINSISALMLQFQQENHIAFVNDSRVLEQSSATLFGSAAFNKGSLVPGPEFALTSDKVELGKMLFYNNLLSKSNNRNCASCHQPDKAFADKLAKSMSIDGKTLQRNTPTLLYAGLQYGLFWDMRQQDLEAQSLDVINNKDEMHGDLSVAIARIEKTDSLQQAFVKAFGPKPIEPWMVQNSLASYIRSLAPFSSRFDAYMQGDTSAMNEMEQIGFNLFMGKAKCGGCHFMPIFNGMVPPKFNQSESEVLGIPATSHNKKLDTDPGRYAQHQVPSFRNAFKIPTLRNIARTAPYMHNGVYNTLEQVMEFYNKGGAVGMGIAIDNQSLAPDALQLSPAEIKSVIAFLHTLTDSL